PEAIAKASKRLVKCLLNDRKILVCGKGSSAANGLHFTSAMMSQFEVERPSLPAIMLSTDMVISSAIMHSSNADEIFSKQIQAIAQEGDVLIMLSTSGNSDKLVYAMNAANDRGVDIVALTGGDGGVLATHLGPEDIEIRVPSDNSARIR